MNKMSATAIFKLSIELLLTRSLEKRKFSSIKYFRKTIQNKQYQKQNKTWSWLKLKPLVDWQLSFRELK